MQQLAQEDAVAQRLGQVEDHGRGPHDPVVGRQDLAVDEPAAALPPLLHGARGAHPPAARWAGRLRAALRPKCSGRGASRPPARGSAAGAGLRAGGPGSPLRRRASLLFLLRLLARRSSRPRAAVGQPPGSASDPRFTHTSPPGPRAGLRAARHRSAPRSAPPGAAFCARGAPRPPKLLPRPRQRPGGSPVPRVRGLGRPRRRRRFVRPAFALSAPRPGLRLRGSAAPGRRGRGGAATGGVGAGPARSPGTAPARPPPPLPARLPLTKVAEGGGCGAAGARGPPTSARGTKILRKLCARGARPRLWSDGRSLFLRLSCVSGGAQEVAPVALGGLCTVLREGQTLEGAPTARSRPAPSRSTNWSPRENSRREAHGPGTRPDPLPILCAG